MRVIPCNQCNGTGTIELFDFKGFHKEECGICKGTGQVYAQEASIDTPLDGDLYQEDELP